jgi:hypothetical protein
LAALCDPEQPVEARRFVASAQWVTVVVLFYSGVQKVVQGYYFDGSMLTYSLSTNSFRGILQLLLPASEFERLAALGGAAGEGPYSVDSPLLLAASNGIWLAELSLPALMLWRRTAPLAALATLVLLLGIEIGAREVFFGLIFSNGVLLFLPAAWQRWALPFTVSLLGALLASRLGLLPEVVFY